MTATEIIREGKKLPNAEKLQVIHHLLGAVDGGDAGRQKAVERLLRRLENPDNPEEMFRAMEDIEDGRTVEMETALHDKPPWRR